MRSKGNVEEKKRERREGRVGKFTEVEREEIQGRDPKIRKEKRRWRKGGRKEENGEEAQNTGRVTGRGKRKRGKRKRIEKGRNSEEWFADEVKTKMWLWGGKKVVCSKKKKKNGILK